MFDDDAGWHIWTPEVIRRVAGSPRCAMPKTLPNPADDLAVNINTWGPLLPLLHFHLGWQRIDIGLVRWARTGFDPIGDPTLKVIAEIWGPALGNATEWSIADGRESRMGNELTLPAGARSSVLANPDGLHLHDHQTLAVDWQNHWNSPYRLRNRNFRESDLVYECRRLADGTLELIVPNYYGWYRLLEIVGDRLEPLSSGRSWRVDVTITAIGFVGTFRKSRLTGRWFVGRHKAHQLGVSDLPPDQTPGGE